MRPPVHVPARAGLAALDELSQVPWAVLHHAYGQGVTGREVHHDVARSLRAIAHEDGGARVDALWSNICHQGTVYEATAYAVPFVAAIAAGDVDGSLRRELVNLLGHIALAASFVTENGSRAGAYGDGVDVLVRAAFTRCATQLAVISSTTPAHAAILHAIGAITAAPSRDAYEVLLAALDADGDNPSEVPVS